MELVILLECSSVQVTLRVCLRSVRLYTHIPPSTVPGIIGGRTPSRCLLGCIPWSPCAARANKCVCKQNRNQTCLCIPKRIFRMCWAARELFFIPSQPSRVQIIRSHSNPKQLSCNHLRTVHVNTIQAHSVADRIPSTSAAL